MTEEHRGFRPEDERPWWADDEDADEQGGAPSGVRVIGAAPAATPWAAPGEPPLRFADDSGPLPHWSEPPTGELPRVFERDPDEAEAGADDDLAVWSSTTSRGPVWQGERTQGRDWADDLDDLGDVSRREPDAGWADDLDDDWSLEPEPEPERETVVVGGRTPPRRRPVEPAPGRRGDGARPGFTSTRGTGGRDMPTAVGIGLLVAGVAFLCFLFGTVTTVALVVVVLSAAAVELFAAFRRAGWHPAGLLGVVAAGGLPLAAYWRGEVAIPLVLAVATAATLVWFMGEDGGETSRAADAGLTLLGIAYVGVLGSHAALIVKGFGADPGIGILIGAAACTVAYDVAGLFVGSSAGRTQIAPSISPNKTLEGVIGGVLGSVIVGALLTFAPSLHPWDDRWQYGVLLGLVVGGAAFVGDLAESMLKRDLGVKDMGTLLKGHGGVLDRFDGFLFSLPAAYYLAIVLFR